MSDNATTLGAVIIGIPLGIMYGSLCASLSDHNFTFYSRFSGGLVVQCILYFRSARSRNTWRMSSVVSIGAISKAFHSEHTHNQGHHSDVWIEFDQYVLHFV